MIEELASTFTGKAWVLLSDTESTCLQIPRQAQLLVKDIHHDCHIETGRLTSLAADSASAIICDDVLQRHANPSQVLKEMNHLLQPGGLAAICGAGSLRGRIAARLPANSSSLSDVLEWINRDTRLQVLGCYTHGSTPIYPVWRKNLQRFQIGLARAAVTRFPSSLGIAKYWAATRPGWVLLLQDKRYKPLPNGHSQRLNKLFNLNPSGAAFTRDRHQ